MSQPQVNGDRRKGLIMALTSVAVAPVSSLLLNNAAGARHLRRTATDHPAGKGLGYLHDANKSTNSKRKPNQYC